MDQYYIWCFPGTGKSSVSQSVPDVLDADSRLYQFIGATPQMLHNTAARARTVPNPEYPDKCALPANRARSKPLDSQIAGASQRTGNKQESQPGKEAER